MAREANERTKLADALRKLKERRRELDRFGHGWLSQALVAALGGRHALWQALLERSQELIGEIDQLHDRVGSLSISIPANKEAKAVRADAVVMIEHLKAGGKWTAWGVLTPKAVRERTYLRDEVTVDGQPADSQERLQVVCNHLSLTFAINDLENAWTDHGGLPASSQLRMRMAAIKEHVSALEDALDYARACLDVGRKLTAARPSIPEPDWLSGQMQEWLDIIEASAIEELHRVATEQATASLQIGRASWRERV